MKAQLFERYPGNTETKPVPAPQDVVFNPQNATEGVMLNKPDNCLWTSTWTGEKTGSDWIQFILSGEYRSNPFDCYLLTPSKKARILTIDSHADLCKAWRRHMLRRDNWVYPIMDFETIARKYDAMHLTERGNAACHDDRLYINLHWWDVESTVWFRPVWTVEHLGQMTFEIED